MQPWTAYALVPVTGLVALTTACGNQPAGNSAGAIKVEATDTACTLSTTTAPAGTLTFDISNKGSQVNEFYLYGPGDKIVSEVENIGPGLTRQLVVQIPQGGKYTTACKPGMQGDGIRGEFTVTGSAASANTGPAADAINAYKKYVDEQADGFKATTGQFTDAVKAGKVDEAKNLYPKAREYWERIEPVAESFGDLDKEVDGREADLEPGKQFTGYHRLEKDLWVTGLQPDSPAMADKLNADVGEIMEKSRGVELNPAKIANGAKELLDEVSRSKVTGEEETFSHTDLWDFQANVDGAAKVVDVLRPILQQRDPALLSTLDSKFKTVNDMLAKYRSGEGFVFYTALQPDQVKELAAAVDALGEPLSKTAGVVAQR